MDVGSAILVDLAWCILHVAYGWDRMWFLYTLVYLSTTACAARASRNIRHEHYHASRLRQKPPLLLGGSVTCGNHAMEPRTTGCCMLFTTSACLLTCDTVTPPSKSALIARTSRTCMLLSVTSC